MGVTHMVSGFKNGQNKFEEDFEIPLLFRILYYFHRRKCLGHFFVNVSYSKSSEDVFKRILV